MYSNKIDYNILICDDNIEFIKRLRDGISLVNSKSDIFHLNVDIGTTPSECMSSIQKNNMILLY